MISNYIMEKLHCDQPMSIQREGISLALKEEKLDLILYHSNEPEYAENCAEVIIASPYEKTHKYFSDLFSWIEDLNAIGAEKIFNYLSKAPAKLLYNDFKIAMEASLKRKSQEMLRILKMLLMENKELSSMFVKRQ